MDYQQILHDVLIRVDFVSGLIAGLALGVFARFALKVLVFVAGAAAMARLIMMAWGV